MQDQLTPARKTTGRFVDSTHLLGDGNALGERAKEDGYLFFRKLIPKDEILALRQDLLGVVEACGWRQTGQNPLGGLVDVEAINRVPAEQMRLDIGVSIEAYRAVQKLESVHRLPHHANLVQMYRDLFGSGVLVHPRHIIRMITPHRSMVPTPRHQDFPLIQGTTQTWTCWFPVGDCPMNMGGLAVLKGSQRLGSLPIQETEGAGGLLAQLCPGEDDGWVSGDYEAGDVLTFSSLTVHRALPSRVRDQIRLSMDVRYQAAEDIIEEKSLLPHCHLEWDEIYADWKRDDLKYYWRRSTQNLSPWDDSLKQPRQRIC